MAEASVRSGVCYHEAGHAVAATLCGFPVDAVVVTEDLQRRETALTPSTSFRTTYEMCFVLMAGLVAENLQEDRARSTTPIATDDLIRVTLILDTLHPEGGDIDGRSEWIYARIDDILEHVERTFSYVSVQKAVRETANLLLSRECVSGADVQRLAGSETAPKVIAPDWWWEICRGRGLESTAEEVRGEWRDIWGLPQREH